jgi:hypothetical protein
MMWPHRWPAVMFLCTSVSNFCFPQLWPPPELVRLSVEANSRDAPSLNRYFVRVCDAMHCRQARLQFGVHVVLS